MYCGKCGAKNPAGTAFCGSCGAPLGAEGTGAAVAVEEKRPGASAGQSASRNRKIGMIAVAAAAVVLVFAVFSLFGGRSDKQTAEQFVEAVFRMDAEAIVDLLPRDVIRTMEEKGYDEAELLEELDNLARDARESLLPRSYQGGEIDAVCHVVDVSEVEGSQLTLIQGRYYTEVGMTITAAREVSVSLRIQSKELEIDTERMLEVPVVKSGGKWYVDAINI